MSALQPTPAIVHPRYTRSRPKAPAAVGTSGGSGGGRQLFGARRDDDAAHLYGVAGTVVIGPDGSHRS